MGTLYLLSMASYEEKKHRLIEEMKAASGATVSLAKDTSNLFRNREGTAQKKLNVRDFNQVISVNAQEGWVEV